MAFFDTLVAAITAKLAEIKGGRPVLAILFGKGPTGEPVAISVGADGEPPMLGTPTIPTAITASDATDLSALTTKGVLVGGDGTVIVRGTGAPATSVTITALAGQYLPIRCSRIMAASTATGLVGLS